MQNEETQNGFAVSPMVLAAAKSLFASQFGADPDDDFEEWEVQSKYLIREAQAALTACGALTPLGVGSLPPITSIPSSALRDPDSLVYFAKQYGLACAQAVADARASELARLRSALSQCATAVGASATSDCSVEFLVCVPREVELVVGKVRTERDTLLQRVGELEVHAAACALVQSDTARLTADLGRIIDGPNAAEAPSLCDLIHPATELRMRCDIAEAERDSLRRQLEAKGADASIEFEPGRSVYLSDLVRCAVMNLRVRPKHKGMFWPAVKDAFGVGSTVAQAICRWAGHDPDSGSPIAARSPHPTAGADQEGPDGNEG